MCLSAATTADAQQPDQPPQNPPATGPQPATGSRLLDQINQRSLKSGCKGDYCILTGQVELPLGTQTTLFADQIELFRDTNRVIAQGNVVFASPEGRLSADRLEYDVASGTGTFHDATGLMSLGAQADRRQFGNQEADVYFYGEVIERLGPRRYRLTRGAFTTCVQPTPRWEVASGSVTLNLNDYAVAKGTTLRVKGVPVMYLPMIYYPIREDQRSTGFLLPTYGTSTVRGQAISNAFFWAINRSTDATFFHDWFTKAGQGAGAEYRYVAAAQSMGDVRFYRFNQDETTFVNGNQTQTLQKANSYEVTGNLNHALTRNIRARARLDYFTDLVTQQLYNQNLYAATRNRRLIEGGLTAGFGPLMTSMLYQRSELFTSRKDLADLRQRATGQREPRTAAPVQCTDLCLRERGVRGAPQSLDQRWRRRRRQWLLATRHLAHGARAALAVDVPVGQHERRVPGDALFPQRAATHGRDGGPAVPSAVRDRSGRK